MDRVGEARFQMAKRENEFVSAAAVLTASGNGKAEAKRSVNGVRVVRRAPGRKDSHGKVFTARGARDRRVRLSPKTAIHFYDVQERLGCDRPSKAIDWLMKEAKAAIDALDHRPPTAAADSIRSAAATNAAESINDDIVNPISGLDLFSGTAAAPPPPPEESQGRSGAGGNRLEQFMSAQTPLELFDVNSEIVRLQRFLSWNYADAPLHYPAPAPDLFAEREPLQSSHSRINYSNSTQFQGFGFPDQKLPTIKEDESNSSFEQVSFLPTL